MKKKLFNQSYWMATFLVLFFAMASMVHAQSMPFPTEEEPSISLPDAYGIGDWPSVGVSLDGINRSWFTNYTFYPYGDDFGVDAFCVSTDSLSSTPGYSLNLIPEDAALYTAAIVASGYFFGDQTNRSAYQLAIWEIMFDTTDEWDLTDGNFQALDPDLAADANAILASIGSMKGHVAWAQSDEDNINQDFLVPVPEPAAILLIALGLIGIVTIGRKRFNNS